MYATFLVQILYLCVQCSRLKRRAIYHYDKLTFLGEFLLGVSSRLFNNAKQFQDKISLILLLLLLLVFIMYMESLLTKNDNNFKSFRNLI